jgi:hypothetical protein
MCNANNEYVCELRFYKNQLKRMKTSGNALFYRFKNASL